MEISLNKKVIVISGGTKGVGKQLALQCATDGAHVVISGRDEASATSIIEAAKKAPGTIEFKKTDLHSVSSIRELFAYVADKYKKTGRIRELCRHHSCSIPHRMFRKSF